MTSVTESVAKIPYGIRYFSMRMRQALSEQFPHASKEEVCVYQCMPMFDHSDVAASSELVIAAKGFNL